MNKMQFSTNFKKNPLNYNLTSFKQLEAKARKTIKQAKRTSWQSFVNQLNSSTKTNTVWKIVRKIAGKNKPTPLKHLIKNKIQITNIKDIADTLAETFSTNSFSKNFKTEFHKYKATKEKQKLNFQLDNTENYKKIIYIVRTTGSHPKIS